MYDERKKSEKKRKRETEGEREERNFVKYLVKTKRNRLIERFS